MKLNLKEIRVDGGTQPRAELLIDVMEDYAEQMREGVKFPPIVVFFDGKAYWLADGYHRMGAHLRAFGDDTPIEAEVVQGTQVDAQWYSFGVNKTHGLRRTNEDKARAVKAALKHPKSNGLSDAAIAEHVGVHRNTVLKIRRDSEDGAHLHKLCKSDSRTGRDGRTINTAKIGKGPRKESSRNGRGKGVRISRNAHPQKIGHSSPCPMIPLQFSPNNPQTAAATLWQHFSRSFLETLIQELTQHLSTEEGEAA